MIAERNQEWLERNFPCRWACPVHPEAGKYVNLISQGRFREAYAVARRPNPLASICGRICAALQAICQDLYDVFIGMARSCAESSGSLRFRPLAALQDFRIAAIVGDQA